MTTIFLFCALVGGTILMCQFVLTLVGLGGSELADTPADDLDLSGETGPDLADDAVADADAATGEDATIGDEVHGHHGAHPDLSTWLFGVISFRTLVAAMTFFGLAGMAARSAELSRANQFLIALGCGIGAMYLVHWLMSLLYRLGEDKTVRINHAVGREGTVYLTVPGGKTGHGKIQLNLRGRLMEYEAVTSEPSNLCAGARVVVVGVVGGHLLEVAPAESPAG